MAESYQGEEGILAIYLAEAQEIVQRLSAQLTELQYGYDGQRVLDELHRGFHTLYGGSRVLELQAVAELSLLSAQVIQRLRARRIALHPGLIALIISAVESLALMLQRAQQGETLGAIDPQLSRRLQQTAAGQSPSAEGGAGALNDDITSVDGQISAPAPPPAAAPPTVAAAAPRHTQPLPVFAEEAGDAAPWRGLDDPQGEAVQLAQQLRYFSGELNWLRDLMLRLQDRGSREEKRRALRYLDMLAQDMAQWCQRHGGDHKER